jgi:hypothetical protein
LENLIDPDHFIEKITGPVGPQGPEGPQGTQGLRGETEPPATLTSVGTTSLIVDGIGPDFVIKGIKSGTGIDVGYDDTDLIITNTLPEDQVTLMSAGSGASLVQDETGPTLTVKSLFGDGITINEYTNNLSLVNASPASSVTLTDTTTNTSLIKDGIGADLSLYGLKAGTGIGLILDANDITVTNTLPEDQVTLTDTTTSTTLIKDGIGPSLSLYGLKAGAGIGLSLDANDVTLANVSPVTTISFTLDFQGPWSAGSNPTVKFKGIMVDGVVTLYTGRIQVTVSSSTASGSIYSTSAIPASYRPGASSTYTDYCVVADRPSGGSLGETTGRITVEPSGIVYIGPSAHSYKGTFNVDGASIDGTIGMRFPASITYSTVSTV